MALVEGCYGCATRRSQHEECIARQQAKSVAEWRYRNEQDAISKGYEKTCALSELEKHRRHHHEQRDRDQNPNPKAPRQHCADQEEKNGHRNHTLSPGSPFHLKC